LVSNFSIYKFSSIASLWLYFLFCYLKYFRLP
jgi:hypothetical protein